MKSAASRASGLAERVLRVDPSLRTLQDASSQLSAAAAALVAGDGANARAALERVSATIIAVLRRELPDAPRRASTIDEARRDGAFVDALRSVRPR